MLKSFIPTATSLLDVRRHHTNSFQTFNSPNPVTSPTYVLFPLVEEHSDLSELKLNESKQGHRPQKLGEGSVSDCKAEWVTHSVTGPESAGGLVP